MIFRIQDGTGQNGARGRRWASNAHRVFQPVPIQHGTADTSFSGQQELLEGIGSKDKTLKLYEGLRHEVHNELPPDRARALSDLHRWLDGHLQQ